MGTKVIEIKSVSMKPKKHSNPKRVKETNDWYDWYKKSDAWEVVNEYEISEDEEDG